MPCNQSKNAGKRIIINALTCEITPMFLDNPTDIVYILICDETHKIVNC